MSYQRQKCTTRYPLLIDSQAFARSWIAGSMASVVASPTLDILVAFLRLIHQS